MKKQLIAVGLSCLCLLLCSACGEETAPPASEAENALYAALSIAFEDGHSMALWSLEQLVKQTESLRAEDAEGVAALRGRIQAVLEYTQGTRYLSYTLQNQRPLKEAIVSPELAHVVDRFLAERTHYLQSLDAALGEDPAALLEEGGAFRDNAAQLSPLLGDVNVHLSYMKEDAHRQDYLTSLEQVVRYLQKAFPKAV